MTTFNLQSSYLIGESRQLSNIDQQVLTELYLPMIGVKSYAIFNLLAQQVHHKQSVSQRLSHNDLLDLLGLNVIDFETARQRLEAIGLLQTFYNKDALGEYYLYQLYPPVEPADFFSDALLSGLLYQMVGEIQFKQLKQQFKAAGIQSINGDNVSSSFLDIFGPFVQVPKDLQDDYDTLAASKRPEPIVDHSFDFEAFSALLSNSGVTNEHLRQKKSFVLTQHTLYGVDEPTLVNVVRKHLSLDTREIDEQGVMNELIAIYGSQSKTESVQPSASQVETKAETKVELTAAQKQLVAAANQLSPILFLKQIKQERNGFVANAEQRVLQELNNRQLLPTSVINILIYHVLVNMNNANLTKNLVDAIANDWAQKQLRTPEAAIETIKQRQATKKSSEPRRVNKREIQPDYSQQTNQVDSAQLIAAQKQLAALNEEAHD